MALRILDPRTGRTVIIPLPAPPNAEPTSRKPPGRQPAPSEPETPSGARGTRALSRSSAESQSVPRSRSYADNAVRLLVPALLALTLGAAPAAARPFSAVCTNLSGMRVDDTAAEPAFTRDAVAGAAWTYTWDVDTKKATLTLPASQSSDGRPHTQAGAVSFHRGGFFTIVSALPGAVWTHAIYADTGRLLVTQSTTKNSAQLSGRMLVGTCTLSP